MTAEQRLRLICKVLERIDPRDFWVYPTWLREDLIKWIGLHDTKVHWALQRKGLTWSKYTPGDPWSLFRGRDLTKYEYRVKPREMA